MKFGRYEIIQRLGTGGMGEVYLARMTGPHGFEKKVVIKKILAHLSRDEEFIRRFIDEGKIVVRLTHSNIVQIYDMGIEDGEYFMAMEYVDGLDLKELISRVKPSMQNIPQDLALFILQEICKGLSYAHLKKDDEGKSLNIVHRDLSPANIILSKDGEVKICDFGVAKAAGRLTLSLPGILHGKYLYLSPEQARGDEIDYRSDIFSLGILGYEILTFIKPFDGDNDLEILEKIKNTNPLPPSRFNAAIQPVLDGIILKCLNKDRDMRYQSTGDLLSVLTKYFYETHTIVGNNELKKYLQTFFETDKIEQKPVHVDLDEAISENLKQFKDSPPREVTINMQDLQKVENPAKPEKKNNRKILFFASAAIFIAVILSYFSLFQDNFESPSKVFAGVQKPFENKIKQTIQNLKNMNLTISHKTTSSIILLSASKNKINDFQITGSVDRYVTVRSVPEGGEVIIGGKNYGTSPARIPFTRGVHMKGFIKLPDHEKSFFSISDDSPQQITVKLRPVKVGRITFRFFPADSDVIIDGESYNTAGKNLVDIDLSEGEHSLTISSPDGNIKKNLKIKVANGKTSNLGTIDISK
jgi:serine/threonine protein kinase